MGQAATKERHHGHDDAPGSSHPHAGPSSSSSSAQQTPRRSYPSSVDGGALEPQGVYTGPQDYDHDVVKTAIVQRKLMPFYKGLDDQEEYQDRPNCTECPICFLYYPSTLNKTRCCSQPICTECFVQIKRADPNHTSPPSSQPSECPYCTVDNFGVIFERPAELPSTSRDDQAVASGSGSGSGSPAKSRRKSFAHTDPDVLTTDMVRPDWSRRLASAQATITRRANRRIIMRQVGDRLIPIGISSSRTGAELPEGTGPGGAIILREGEQWGPFSSTEEGGSGRRGSRRGGSGITGGMSGADVEEMMLMEAMRLSLLEHEEQQRREAAANRAQGGQSGNNDSATPTSPRAAAATTATTTADSQSSMPASSSGSGLGRSSSTSRGQPMPATSERAYRLSQDMRQQPASGLSGSSAAPHQRISSISSINESSQPSASRSEARSMAPVASTAPVLRPINFDLGDDVLADLAELIDEPDEETRSRMEAIRRTRAQNEETRRLSQIAATNSTRGGETQGSSSPRRPASTQLPPSTPPRFSSQSQDVTTGDSGPFYSSSPFRGAASPALSPHATPPASPSSPAARRLNPNNPFRSRVASSGAHPSPTFGSSMGQQQQHPASGS